jgi:hypothetical protein
VRNFIFVWHDETRTKYKKMAIPAERNVNTTLTR